MSFHTSNEVMNTLKTPRLALALASARVTMLGPYKTVDPARYAGPMLLQIMIKLDALQQLQSHMHTTEQEKHVIQKIVK